MSSQTFLEHLAELRRRLIMVAVVLGAGTVAAFPFAGQAYRLLVAQADFTLVVLAVEEAFYLHLRIAFAIGLVLALPVLLYHTIAFIVPALTRSEQRKLFLYLPMGFLLFLGGIAFAYWQVFPLLLRFFIGFTSEELSPVITAGSYLGFVLSTILPFGFLFELPLVVVLLTSLGILTPDLMVRNRKFVILALFVVAALLTPPDVVSQLLLAAPLLVLYEASILISSVIMRTRRRERSPA
ncbi:MAG: twin-arginine translocase subunit TatC [bacterium]|nr:twin-arginine translocase subunit TatC [bacterium]